MKGLQYIGLLMLPVLGACSDFDDVVYHIEEPTDHMHLSANGDRFIMTADEEDAEVLTFTWEPAADRGATATITYFYRIALADAIKDAVLEPVDNFKVSYTGDELNEMLKSWGVTIGTPVEITAEVIAAVDDPNLYHKPETSFCTVVVAGYNLPTRPYFIQNAAVDPGYNAWFVPMPDNEAVEITPSRSYSWSGWFEADKPVSFNTAADGSGTAFSVAGSTSFAAPKDGYYTLTVNKKAGTVDFDIFRLSSKVYVFGTAFPCVWDIKNPIELQPSPDAPEIFTWTGNVVAGQEMKGLASKGSWAADAFGPYVNGTDPDADDRIDFIAKSKQDRRWKFKRGGRCTIEFNMNLMRIKVRWLD